MIFMGIDLAWGQGSTDKVANESSVVVLITQGDVVDAGWTVGIREAMGEFADQFQQQRGAWG